MGISAYALAKSIYVDPTRISEIIKGKRKITADTVMRFAQFFGTFPEFWMNMQSRYDLELLKEQKEHEFSRITRCNRAS